MPALPKGRSARAGARPGRWAILWPILLALLLILGGVETLALGVVRVQDAARLAAAPVCAAGQQAGCRLDERVTVVNHATEYAVRSGNPTQVVKVQTPDGGIQTVYTSDQDSSLWSRLYVSEALNAELWNGSVIRLDDGAGHSLLADDSPAVTAVLFPIIGLLAVLAGGFILVLVVRSRRRPGDARR